MRITWRDRFPKSMLANTEKVSEAIKKLREVRSHDAVSLCVNLPIYGDNVDCHEVYPNIFLGDGFTAKNLVFLKKLGITHVVNTAMGTSFTMVDTSKDFYKKSDIKFLGFGLNDTPTANIAQHFHSVADFMEDALKSFGKVYVHCFMGISRSSTCIIAFLMLKREMSAVEAFKTCRLKRFICPNDGFIKQLAELEVKLQERRELNDSGPSDRLTPKKHLCDLS